MTAKDGREARTSPGVGDRVRAKTTLRTGKVVEVADHGDGERLKVAYDPEPQDEFLTTPAKDGAELPTELVAPEPPDERAEPNEKP